MDRPRCDSVISYRPIDDEPDPDRLGLPSPSYTVPSRANTPLEETIEAAKAAVTGRVCILVPGRAFDRTGTRHGRGGGWYDRFLAGAPNEWTRVGVTTPERVVTTPLVRQPHDMPVDVLAIVSAQGVEWVKI